MTDGKAAAWVDAGDTEVALYVTPDVNRPGVKVEGFNDDGFDKLDVVGRFDRGIRPIKERDRGATAGELLVSMAQFQLLGADALVGLDRQRAESMSRRSSSRRFRCWPRPLLRV